MLELCELLAPFCFDSYPDHEIEIHIVYSQVFQRRINTFGDTVVPRVVQFGGQPDFFTWNAAVLDSLANFLFILVRQGSINVSVAPLERDLDCVSNIVGLDIVASVNRSED